MLLPRHPSCEANQGSRLRRSAKDVIVIGMPCPGMALSRENNVSRASGAGRTLFEGCSWHLFLLGGTAVYCHACLGKTTRLSFRSRVECPYCSIIGYFAAFFFCTDTVSTTLCVGFVRAASARVDACMYSAHGIVSRLACRRLRGSIPIVRAQSRSL